MNLVPRLASASLALAALVLVFAGCTSPEPSSLGPPDASQEASGEGVANRNEGGGTGGDARSATRDPVSSDLPAQGPAASALAPDGRTIHKRPTTSEMDSLHDRCRREAEAAKSRAEFDAASQRCRAAFEEANGRGDKSVAANGDLEIVTKEDLMAWWPFRPLLRLPASDHSEMFGAVGPKGGRASDPREEPASVEIYYAGQVSIYEGDLKEFYRGGGIVVSTLSPKGTPPAHGTDQRPVTIRGGAGTLSTVATSKDARTWFLSWTANVGRGEATYAMTADVENYPEPDFLQRAESLIELS